MYIQIYMSQSMDRHKKYKDRRFFLYFFIHDISKDTDQQFITIFIPYILYIYCESARKK